MHTTHTATNVTTPKIQKRTLMEASLRKKENATPVIANKPSATSPSGPLDAAAMMLPKSICDALGKEGKRANHLV
jgi:hypothetical protein